MDISKDKILGCLLCGAIGDAIGSKYEGKKIENDEFDLLAGDITDDTQLTLATCQSFTEHKKFNPEFIANKFASWHRKRSFRGLGSSTLKALNDLTAGQHWYLSGAVGERSAGNGSAIRSAPLAFILDPNIPEEKQLITEIAKITHKNDEAYLGALSVIHTLRYLINNNPDVEKLFNYLYGILPDSRIRDKFGLYLKDLNGLNIVEASVKFGNSGYVVESVPFSIFSGIHGHQIGIIDMLSKIIKSGGDTDSNAAMASQIFGFLSGIDKIDQALLNKINQYDFVLKVFEEFAENV